MLEHGVYYLEGETKLDLLGAEAKRLSLCRASLRETPLTRGCTRTTPVHLSPVAHAKPEL